jgi:hypothetical protein
MKPKFEVIEGGRPTTILDALSDSHKAAAKGYEAVADMFRGTPAEALFSGFAAFHSTSSRIVNPRTGQKPALRVVG